MTRQPPSPEEIEQDFTTSFVVANLVALPLALVPLATVVTAHGGLHGFGAIFSWRSAIVLAAWLVPLIVVHELLHAVGFVAGGASRRQIAFGVDMKTLTPFAHCTRPLASRAMRYAIALPGVVLGVLPAVVGLATGTAVLSVLGGVGMAAAGGDVLVLWLIRRVPSDQLLADHPSRVGCYTPSADEQPSRPSSRGPAE